MVQEASSGIYAASLGCMGCGSPTEKSRRTSQTSRPYHVGYAPIEVSSGASFASPAPEGPAILPLKTTGGEHELNRCAVDNASDGAACFAANDRDSAVAGNIFPSQGESIPEPDSGRVKDAKQALQIPAFGNAVRQVAINLRTRFENGLNLAFSPRFRGFLSELESLDLRAFWHKPKPRGVTSEDHQIGAAAS